MAARPSRFWRLLSLAGASVIIALGAFVGIGSRALAGPLYQFIDDTCNQGGPNSGQFYADGPKQYWHDATYTGGPDPCMMWTYNEGAYTNPQYGNEAYWYNCIGTCSGHYYVEAFIPSVHASTTQAIYQIWEHGHNQSGPSWLCTVDQKNIYNTWVTLCPVVNPVYMCGITTCGGFILLQDGTGEKAGTTQVGYDNGYYGYDGP